MSLIVTSEYVLQQVAPPALPQPTGVYSQAYHDQLNNVLRLYFNRLQSLLGQLDASDITAGLLLPYGAFQDTAYTTLNGGINNSVTTITVVSTAGFPAVGQIRIASEVITYTGITPTTFTGCTRGARGSANVAHSTGVAVTKIQSPPAATAVPMYVNTTDYVNNVSIVNETRMTAAKAGIYNLQWSGQFNNSDSAIHDASVWLRVNGVDVVGSTGFISVVGTHGGLDGHAIIGWNYFLQLNAGQYVEIWWSTTDQKVTLECYGPSTGPTRPATASVVATLAFVSALPP